MIVRGVLIGALMCWAGAAAAQTAGDSQETFTARCLQDQRGNPGAEGACAEFWQARVNVGRLAEAVLALAPPVGQAFDAPEAKSRATGVRWERRARAGVTKGRLGDARVTLAAAPVSRADFRSLRDDYARGVGPALEARGATAAEIACLDYGPVFTTRVYRVSATGKAPFTLTITDSQHRPRGEPPEYVVSADFGFGRDRFENVVDDRPGWRAACD